MNYDLPRPPDSPKYKAYLRSIEWNKKRDSVFQREKGICQGCAEEPIENVHHMTYANLYDELLFQLVGVCENCHRKVHWINQTMKEVPDDLEY